MILSFNWSRDTMDPANHISRDPEISTTTRKIHDYARKCNDDEEERQRTNDLDILWSRNPEIKRYRDSKAPEIQWILQSSSNPVIQISRIPEIEGARYSIDSATHRSSGPEISTTTRKIYDYARKSDNDEKELQRSNDLDIQQSSNPKI